MTRPTTLRSITWLWLPLLSSWLLMTTEGPVVTALINRLPDAVEALAAMGLVISIAVTVESPIINLLATSTALVSDRQSYRIMRKFTLHWMMGLTFVGAVLAFTPLFDLVVNQLMGTPPQVASRVQLGLKILVPWTAAIAWRRFLQGLLIGVGKTRPIALGTFIRLVVTSGTALGGFLLNLPGVAVGASALLAGGVTEAVYATWVTRSLIRDEFLESNPTATPLTYKHLRQFHMPLASTSILTLLLHPVVNGCLARLDRPVESIAAWSLIFQFMLIARSGAFALPEVIISLLKKPNSYPALRRFSLGLSAATGLAMALFGLTPLAWIYIDSLQQAPESVRDLARLGFILLIPVPVLATLTSWLRGQLIHLGFTGGVHRAMWARLFTSVGCLSLGLVSGWHGIATACAAAVASNTVELISLGQRLRRHRLTGS